MAVAGSEDYYIGVLPKPPLASNDLIDLLVRNFRAFRLEVLSEANHKALGRSEYDAESRRSKKSYHEDLVNSRNFWFACFVAPVGLDGNIFRNISKSPSASHIPDSTVSADDERIVRDGRWIGLCSAHGPIPREYWQLQALQGSTLPDDVESRFHLANLYFLQGHRGVKVGENEMLFLTLCQASYDYLERLAYTRASRTPAFCRLRGTITPDAVGTKLMQLYMDLCGYHITGWVPQVTAMLLNGAKVETWPAVDDNPSFYTSCRFPTFERLSRIDKKDGVYVLTQDTRQGEIWSRL